MFIKTEHLHLTYVFPIIVVVRALDSQFRSPGFKTTWWLQVQVILSTFWGRLLGTHGAWVVKSKLSPPSGSVALRQLNPIHKKETKSFEFFI